MKKGLITCFIVSLMLVTIISNVSSKDISISDNKILENNPEIEPLDTLREIFTKIHIGVPEGASYTVKKSGGGIFFRHVEIWCEENFDISGYYLDSIIPRYFSVTVHSINAPRCFVYFEGNQYPGLIGVHAFAIGNIEWS
jgi:hypothetical protein